MSGISIPISRLALLRAAPEHHELIVMSATLDAAPVANILGRLPGPALGRQALRSGDRIHAALARAA